MDDVGQISNCQDGAIYEYLARGRPLLFLHWLKT